MNVAPPHSLLDEMADFVSSAPSLEAIVAFQPSDALKERMQVLLDRNERGELSPDDREELDRFLQMDHFLTMIKLKARLRLSGLDK